MKKANEPFIQVKNLSIAYGDNLVVRDLNFTINRGDVFVIMGMSGCGKSTVMRSIIGLVRPSAGHILINGMDLWALSESERSKIIETFGISYQSGALFSSMTIYENVALPLEMKTDIPTSEIKKRVEEKLKLVGLSGFGDFYPNEISGGMIKRAALARAMITNPHILFFDEPASGLDPLRTKLLDDLISDISKKTGTTVVMVTHELDSVMTIATNSVFIDYETKTVTGGGNPKTLLRTTKDDNILAFLTRDKTHIGGKK